MWTEKTAKQTTDIILYDHKVVVFKMESDVMLYVVGSAEENEVLLYRCGSCAWGPEAVINQCPVLCLR
jgi:hypothetical protein